VVEAAGILVKLDLVEDSDGPWAGFVGVATLTSRASSRLLSALSGRVGLVSQLRPAS